MPHRQPGWALANGHIVRSQSEAALCDYLTEKNAAHEHWALPFDLPIGPKRWQLFVPSISLTEIKRFHHSILIQPITSIQPGGGVRMLQTFRKVHGREYFVVVVARRALHHRIPEAAYDLLLPVEDFAPLGKFLAELSL